MARNLDKNRPFAEIFGAHSGKYEQFGILFDAEGIELEGYEDVVIPDAVPVITTDSKEPELRAEIDRLAADLSQVTAALAERDAEIEEIQGKLDTAQVEIGRLTAVNEPAAGKDGKKKATGAADTPLDAQLAAQGAL